MKRKLLIGIFALLLLLAAFFAVLTNGFQRTFSTGICLVMQNDAVIVVVDDSPIVITNRSPDPALLDGLKTGEKVVMLHDGIAKSYPCQTSVYCLFSIGNPGIGEVSADTINTLTSLGWALK